MKQDPDWPTVSTSFNPLALYSLIEKTVLTQSETLVRLRHYLCPGAGILLLQEPNMSNTQWYERFNEARCGHCSRCHPPTQGTARLRGYGATPGLLIQDSFRVSPSCRTTGRS